MRSCSRISIFLPDLRGGGAERVSINLANEFVARGFSVDMVVMAATGALMPLLHPEVRIVDLGVSRVRSVLWPLIGYLRSQKPTAMLANMWPMTVLPVIARWISRSATRVVAVEHVVLSKSEISDKPLHMLALRILGRLLLPKADAIVGVSNGVVDDLASLASLDKSRLTTIYNPIAMDRAPSVSTLPCQVDAWADAEVRILNVGTLKLQKDQHTLLRAFSLLLKTRKNARLLFLGEGTLEEQLQESARELGILDRVTFAGFAADPIPYYKHASLFVLSSAWEGFGNVIVEALEQGTPVVSTDCLSGPREILADGKYGSLVPVGDVDALAKAIEEAVNHDHDREGLKRRAQDFSVGKATDAYLDLLVPGWRECVKS